jgi:ribosomal protein L21E
MLIRKSTALRKAHGPLGKIVKVMCASLLLLFVALIGLSKVWTPAGSGSVIPVSEAATCTAPTPAEISAVVLPRMLAANRVTGAMGTSQVGTKPIYVYDLDYTGPHKGQYFAVVSSMAIDTDGSDTDSDPDHQSETTFQDAQGKQLGSKHVPFWVIDDEATSLPNFPWGSKFNMQGFQVGTMIYPSSKASAGTAKMVYGILGDTQGSEDDIADMNHIGEASQYAAGALGIGTSGTSGGVDSDVMYVFSTGTANRVIPANGYTGTNATLATDAAKAGASWMCQMIADLGGTSAATKYTLTVNTGTGSGSYASGSAVTISANTAPSGQVFDKWTGDTSYIASATSSSTTVTMPEKAISLTAVYKAVEVTKYTLTVSGGSGSGSYASGTSVIITATVPSGKVFSSWSGDTGYVVSTTAATTTVTMPAKAMALTANFTTAPATTYTLTVTSGTGTGSYTAGASVTVAAKAAPTGQVFDKWTGDTGYIASATAATTTVTMPAKAMALTANYKAATANSFTLTVTSGTGSGSYVSGTKVDIAAAAPAAGKTFDKWTGDTSYLASTTSSSTTVTMPAKAATLTATYRTLTTGDSVLDINMLKNPTTVVGKGVAGIQLITFTAQNKLADNLLLSGIQFTGDFKSADVGNLVLYVEGMSLGKPSSVTNTTAVYGKLNMAIPAKTTYTFILKGDISKSTTAASLSYALDGGALKASANATGSSAALLLSGAKAVVMIQSSTASNAPADGAIMRAYNDIDVYIIKVVDGKIFKRLVLSPSVFRSYGHLKWENIIIVNQSVIDAYTTSNLVRVQGKTQVWKLTPLGDSGKKTLVSGSNYDSDSIYTINQTDFDSYSN